MFQSARVAAQGDVHAAHQDPQGAQGDLRPRRPRMCSLTTAWSQSQMRGHCLESGMTTAGGMTTIVGGMSTIAGAMTPAVGGMTTAGATTTAAGATTTAAGATARPRLDQEGGKV